MSVRPFVALVLSLSIVVSLNVYAQKKKDKKKKPSKEEIEKLVKKVKPKKASLDKLLQSDTSTWDMTPEVFEKQWTPFFKWMKKDEKTGARYHMFGTPHRLDLFGHRVWEANARFKDGKFNEIEVSLYNRGDANTLIRMSNGKKENLHLNETKFKELLKDLNSKINEWLQTKGKVMPPRKLVGSSKDAIYEEYWVKDDKCVGLQWSGSKVEKAYMPEYLKLTYCKFDPHNDPRKTITRAKNAGRLANVKTLKNNVKQKDGFTYIDNIPMVDQGPKGYCAVAATERVLRYYGAEVDQHQIAQLVKTTVGTNPVKMFQMLKKAGPGLGIKIMSYLDPPDLEKGYNDRAVREYVKQLEKFNKYLKRNDQPEVQLVYPLCAALKGTERLELLKAYKCDKCKRDFNKFKTNIKKNIDVGIPVVWGLFVGIVEEEGKIPQGFGGHMRLIIGYNKDVSKIVFTDTWGAGHEFKTMNTRDAWVVTSFYAVFKPRKNY